MTKYLRIGTDYYKKTLMPLMSGDCLSKLSKWNKGEILLDEGKEYLHSIDKYDGFCLIPSHTNYRQSIKGFYNKYEKIEHEFIKGDFPKTEMFLKHIFGEQYLLFLDYLSILWHHPTQILPVLCLVSAERKTGKTSLINWLKLIFQLNMTINKNEDFRSRFNSDWSDKLIIAVDEVLLDKKEDSERIKNLSTSLSYKTEAKGVDKVETFFFGKFILCSNNEENFIQIDKNEIRYWVIKVPQILDKDENPDLLSVLSIELPYFMYFLQNRKIETPKKTRMWFSKDLIYTEALERLVKGNKTYLNKEIEEIIIDDFIKYEKEELKYSLSDLVELLTKNNVRVSTSKVSEVLKTYFEVESVNGSYPKYFLEAHNEKHFVNSTIQKGRYYTFKRSNFIMD